MKKSLALCLTLVLAGSIAIGANADKAAKKAAKQQAKVEKRIKKAQKEEARIQADNQKEAAKKEKQFKKDLAKELKNKKDVIKDAEYKDIKMKYFNAEGYGDAYICKVAQQRFCKIKDYDTGLYVLCDRETSRTQMESAKEFYKLGRCVKLN